MQSHCKGPLNKPTVSLQLPLPAQVCPRFLTHPEVVSPQLNKVHILPEKARELIQKQVSRLETRSGRDLGGFIQVGDGLEEQTSF